MLRRELLKDNYLPDKNIVMDEVVGEDGGGPDRKLNIMPETC